MPQRVALGRFCADIQQSHSGTLHPHEPPGIEIAQIGKLQQVLRRTVGVGAAVAEDGMTCGRGDHRPHGRPADAPDPLDQQGSPRQQRPGGACGDECVPLPVFQHGQPHRQGGVLLALERSGRVVAHLHHLCGVDDLHALRQEAGQAGPDGLLTAHQHDVRAALGVGLQSALYHRLRRIVAAHGIQNDFHNRLSPFRGQLRPIAGVNSIAIRLTDLLSVPPELPAHAGKFQHSCSACP